MPYNTEDAERGISVAQALATIILLCTNVLVRYFHLLTLLTKKACGDGVVAMYAGFFCWEHTDTYRHGRNLILTSVENSCVYLGGHSLRRQRNADGGGLLLWGTAVISKRLCICHTYLSETLYIYLSIYLSIYQSVHIYLSIYLSLFIDLSIYLSQFFHRSIYLLVCSYLSIYLLKIALSFPWENPRQERISRGILTWTETINLAAYRNKRWRLQLPNKIKGTNC